MTQNILIITEDDLGDDGLVQMLDSWGYKTQFTLKEDINNISELNPDLVIMDIQPDDPDTQSLMSRLNSPTIYLPLVRGNLDSPSMMTYF